MVATSCLLLLVGFDLHHLPTVNSAYIRQKFIIESTTLTGAEPVADAPHQGQELATPEGGQAAAEPGDPALLARKGKG